MELFVNDEMKVAELVSKFSEIYPFLRLEVYYLGEEISNAAHDNLLKDVTKRKLPHNFSLQPENTVAEAEELFWKKMGVQIAIFRKSGKTWLEASYTNYWSLERQNKKGEEMGDFLTTETRKG